MGKAPRVTPVWSSEEDNVFGSSPTADRDCLMVERSSASELESMVGGDNAEADGNVTYIDASGEECLTPSDHSYKSNGSSSLFFHKFGNVYQSARWQHSHLPLYFCHSDRPGHQEDDKTSSGQ